MLSVSVAFPPDYATATKRSGSVPTSNEDGGENASPSNPFAPSRLCAGAAAHGLGGGAGSGSNNYAIFAALLRKAEKASMTWSSSASSAWR